MVIKNRYDVAHVPELFSSDKMIIQIPVLIQHAAGLLQHQTLVAQEMLKHRNVAECAVHFEFYANIHHIIQTLNLERVCSLGNSWIPFIVLPEAKDPAEMGQRHLDLLIHDGIVIGR